MRVTVRRVQTGVAAASTLLVATGAGTLGCGDETQTSEEFGLNDFGEHPGSALLEIQYGPTDVMGVQLKASTTDEFVRVGEKLKMSLPAWLLWEKLYPNDPVPTDDARLKQLSASVKVSFVDKAKTLTSKTVAVASWTGSQWSLTAVSAEFKVPAKTDLIKLALTIKDSAAPTASVTLNQAQMGTIPVFGGDLPNRSLLFDNDNGSLRARIVDGGHLAKSSTVTLGYTDWRADQVVDKSSLNQQIGTAGFSGRFGYYEAPIYGTLSYEVSYAVSFDDGGTFSAESQLAAITTSRLVGANRTDYEGTVKVPSTATEMLLYARVRATLTADYSKFQNVKQKWYGDGQKIVLKDVFDNPSGAFTNYTFAVQ